VLRSSTRRGGKEPALTTFEIQAFLASAGEGVIYVQTFGFVVSPVSVMRLY